MFLVIALAFVIFGTILAFVRSMFIGFINLFAEYRPTWHPSFDYYEVGSNTPGHRVFMRNVNFVTRWWKIFVAEIQDYFGSGAMYCVTSRDDKFREFKLLMPSAHLLQAKLKLPTFENETDLEEIAVFRVLQAHSVIGHACFLDEGSLVIDTPEFETKENKLIKPKPAFPGHHHRQIITQMGGKRKFAADYNGRSATTHTALAYTPDGVTVHVFSGSTRGHIRVPDVWTELDGWDPFFFPSGYSHPLSQLRDVKHTINMRQYPCAELLSMLYGELVGVFELHITVYNMEGEISINGSRKNPLIPTLAYFQQFKDVCAQKDINVKALRIEMEKPTKPVQLQTAAYYVFPNYAAAQKYAFELASKMSHHGLPTLRVRIEAMWYNRDCPRKDKDALKLEANYYEFHARLGPLIERKTTNGFREIKATLADSHEVLDAIVRNAYKFAAGSHRRGIIQPKVSRVNGADRVFVNMRCYKVGSECAETHWREFKSRLCESRFKIDKEVKPEYCVYDDRPELDALETVGEAEYTMNPL